MGIITALLPLALRLVGKYLDGKQASAETKAKYLAFVEAASAEFGSSAALKKSYDAQKARMDAIEAERNKPTGGTPT